MQQGLDRMLVAAGLTGPIDFARRGDRILRLVFQQAAQHRLVQRGREQFDRFERLGEQFPDRYRQLVGAARAEFRTELWDDFEARATAAFSPRPRFNFHADPVVMRTMVVGSWHRWLQDELAYVLQSGITTADGSSLLPEDPVGRPVLFPGPHRTSATAIHHAYHLCRFSVSSGRSLSDFRSVLEWGGGYGSLARQVARLTDDVTYVIVDLPIFSCVQWLYLGSIFGESRAHLSRTGEVVAGKVNLVSVDLARSMDFQPDLFISTWALSESATAAQAWVSERNWFEAKHLLIASAKGSELDAAVAAAGATFEPIAHLPTDHYAFR
jgi:hypothetical protein